MYEMQVTMELTTFRAKCITNLLDLAVTGSYSTADTQEVLCIMLLTETQEIWVQYLL